MPESLTELRWERLNYLRKLQAEIQAAPTAARLAARQAWLDTARPAQLPPEVGHWAVVSGRGVGKTRTGAEQVAYDLLTIPDCRVAVVARTFDDGRDVCIEGESGLLNILGRYGLRQGAGLTWNRSLGELVLDNGARADLYTSDKPDQLRGPQHHVAWADEVAAWIRAQETWDMLEMGLRLGQSPRWYATTTPRPTATVRMLIADAAKVSRESTYDNAANLPVSYLERLAEKYEGTRLGRQELHAELLDDTPGALWSREQIDADRVYEVPYPHTLRSAVVALDPADGTAEGDEQGIAVVGLGWDHEIYVVHSEGMRDTPTAYLTRAVQLAQRWQGRIVMEKNHGGAYLTATLQQVLRDLRVSVPYETVHAGPGKRTRAEPVAAFYERHRVHHVGVFPKLEDQMATWTGSAGEKSPDRLDALVWATTQFLDYSLAPPPSMESGNAVRYTEPRGGDGAVAWDGGMTFAWN